MEKNIDIASLFAMLKKYYKLLLIVPIILAVLGWGVSTFLIHPKYSATSQVLVNQTKTIKQILDQQQQSNSQLVKTYTEVIKTSKILDEVSKELDHKYSAKTLAGMINVNNQAGSELININVVSKHQKDAVAIANTTARVFSNHADLYMNIDKVSVLTNASDAVKVSPKPLKAAVIGFVFGAIAETIVILLVFLLDKRVKNESTADWYLKLPVLGVIKKVKSSKYHETHQQNQILGIDFKAVKAEDRTAFFQQVNQIQANLAMNDDLKSVVITSERAATGKSLLSAHLAAMYAKAGYRTLLIDGNVYHPTQHTMFNVKNDNGLADNLAHPSKISEGIQSTAITNLQLLTAGNEIKRSTEYFSASKLQALIQSLNESYDVLVIDTASLEESPDAQLFAKASKNVLMVVDVKRNHAEALQRAEKLLQRTKAAILGVVLNKA
ncbi:polysaccharide biosynthesis tyrosine autokinase [Staphylococcus simulans]|uniref:polysaccharide biosynthesis tyrosine autokinase n=1 Tax=Staphylococcus simulans TaxID=1286 RepID=UPI001E4A4CF2|nr:polysaccharide biosynthesis tyrosine autokinase [Staphylococcus simulans]MCD8914612.1 polysaccharide biosynthesis tyrosine autokinase [Staphylococcus simulans]